MEFSHYKYYKPALRIEFSHACGYCKNREPELGGSEAFHIDHYKPKSKFPNLKLKYTNLIYACRYCNRSKGNYWPNLTQSVLGQVIINPRTDELEKHIDRSDFTWVGITKKGKWTVLKLRLDSPALVRRRQDRLLKENAIKRLETILNELQERLGMAITQDTDNPEIQMIRQDIAEVVEETNAIRRTIIGPMD